MSTSPYVYGSVASWGSPLLRVYTVLCEQIDELNTEKEFLPEGAIKREKLNIKIKLNF